MKKTIAMLALAPLPVLAAVWHVNASGGSDSNSGAYADSAKASIQAAIDASAAGDVIMVHPGTYAERLEITKKIELRSVSGAGKTTLKGEKGYAVVRIMGNAFGSVVDGLEITGGTGEPNPSSYGHDYYGGGIRCRASATIRNCIIHGNGLGRPRSDSATFGGGIASCSGTVRVENCLIYGNFAWACGGATLVEGDGSEMIFVGCTICGNDSMDFFGYQGGVGMASGGSVKVYNSIVWANGGEQIDAFSNPYNRKTRAEMAYSCIEGGVQQVNVAVLNTGTRNISADPRFIDAAKGDYRLAAGSPCIDAGNNSYSTSSTDIDGKARIANGTVDIGCREYSPAR